VKCAATRKRKSERGKTNAKGLSAPGCSEAAPGIRKWTYPTWTRELVTDPVEWIREKGETQVSTFEQKGGKRVSGRVKKTERNSGPKTVGGA